jgi:hypothetical protein
MMLYDANVSHGQLDGFFVLVVELATIGITMFIDNKDYNLVSVTSRSS